MSSGRTGRITGNHVPDGAISRFALFLEQSERSPATIKNYQSDLRAFAKWFHETNGDEMEPGKVTPTDLREYKQFLLVKRELHPSSVNRQLATLKSFLEWAGQVGLLEGRAPAVPRVVAQTRPGPRWLDRRECNALLRVVERGGKPRDCALLKVLLHTGLRVQELCSLRWQDVTITERKGALVVRNGKGQKRREVPLNADARNAFVSIGYKEHAGSNQAIFHGQRGLLTPRGVQSLLQKYVTAAQLEDITPHTLRHTFCKNLVDAGAGLQEVAALAGHESLEITRRYCEPSLKDLERKVALIEQEG